MTRVEPAERLRRARAAQPAWRLKSVAERSAAVRRLRLVIAARRGEVVDQICRETGKPKLDALAGDIMVTLEQMHYYESRAAHILKTRRRDKSSIFFAGATFHEEFEPYGVALIYGPANYPFQLSVVPMTTALFAGNAVILKCSEQTPGVARMIEFLCGEAQLPEDLVQVVADDPRASAAYIEARPDMVFFTGSSENGRSVAGSAARQLIPAVLELGGKDAALVFSDCNMERAVEGVVYGAFSHAGQVCVGTKRLYVEEKIYPEFLKRLVARIGQLRVGSSPDSDLGVMASEAARSRIREQVAEAIALGAVLSCPASGEIDGSVPILLTKVPTGARVLGEEAFGPVVCAASFADEAEAISVANASSFALSASIWTRDLKRGNRIASALNTGTCAINDVIRNIANPDSAFGGNGHSGYGRYHGPQGLYAFSRVKSVMVSRGKCKREINWFPFSEQTFRRLDALLGWRHGAGELLSGIRRVFFLAMMYAAITLPSIAQSGKDGHLRIRVTTPSPSHGAIAYLVFSSSDGFPNDKAKAVRREFVAVQEADSTVTIDAGTLPPGRYAVSVYQDLNGNHRLDSGMFGIPKEPVGASNNPKPRLGPPRFEDCAFSMGNSDQTIAIALVHAK